MEKVYRDTVVMEGGKEKEAQQKGKENRSMDRREKKTRHEVGKGKDNTIRIEWNCITRLIIRNEREREERRSLCKLKLNPLRKVND